MPSASPVVTVVGIGADGWAGLPEASREALLAAQTLIGGPRQLALLAPACTGERVPWPSPLRPAVPALLAAHADRRIAVLASGDPFFHGIGRALAEVLGADALRVLPHPSAVSYACGRLGWPVEDTAVVTLVGRPTARLVAALHHGRRLLVLSAGAATPAEVAALLRDRGFGPSRLRVLEQLGGARERTHAEGTADGWAHTPGDPLNVVAVECRRAPHALRLGAVPGLPDDAYDHDGQLTKRQVRAATLAALAPAPGELLWDVGGGSGSIAVEWMRTAPSCRAVSVERDSVRAARITANAERLGVPGLRVVTGSAPAALAGLPVPDAVFVGGGLTAPGLLDACWDALPPGGRLVANTVTLESEALLADHYRRHGGDLVRLAVAHAVPVGAFTGWRQAMPVTQWSVTKPAPRAADEATSPPTAGRPGVPDRSNVPGGPGAPSGSGGLGGSGVPSESGDSGGSGEPSGPGGVAGRVMGPGPAGGVVRPGDGGAGTAGGWVRSGEPSGPGDPGGPGGVAGRVMGPGPAGGVVRLGDGGAGTPGGWVRSGRPGRDGDGGTGAPCAADRPGGAGGPGGGAGYRAGSGAFDDSSGTDFG